MHHVNFPDLSSTAVSIRCEMHFARIMNVRIGDGCQKLKVGMGKYSVVRCARNGIRNLLCNVPIVISRFVWTVGAIACDEYSYREDYDYRCHQFISNQLSTPVLRSTHLRNLHRQEEKFGKFSLSSRRRKRNPFSTTFFSGVIGERCSVSAAK